MYAIINISLIAFFLAIAPLNQFVFKKPNTDEIRARGQKQFAFASNLLAQQKYDEARASLEKIVSEFKGQDDPISNYIVQQALYTIGVSYQSEWRYDESIRAMNRLINEYPKTPYAEYAFFSNGKSFKEVGNLKAAIEEFQKIEKNRPMSKHFPKYKNVDIEPGIYVNSDNLAGSSKKDKSKSKVYTREDKNKDAAGGDDNDENEKHMLSDVVIEIGKCFIGLKETQKAREQFALIREFFPGSDVIDKAQKMIADSYLTDGDIYIEKYRRASDKSQKENFHKKAFEYYELAAASYLRFINVYTQSDLVSDVYVKLGDVYYKLNKDKMAEDNFSRAIFVLKQPEMQAKVQLKIGNYFESVKRWDKAIGAYAVVLQNYSKSSVADRAVYLTGVCYEQKGDTAKAIEFFTNICDYYKTSIFFPTASYKLGILYSKKNNFKNALKALRSGVQLSPDSKIADQTQFQIGIIFKEQKEYDAAIEEFQYVVDNYEGVMSSKALFQMVDCYKRLGNMGKAKETALLIKDNNELIIESYKLLGIGASTPEEELKMWQDKLVEAGDDKAKVAAMMEVARIQLYKLGQYDSALVIYNKVMELSKDEIRKINAKVGIAQVYISKENYSKAREVYKEILDNPKTADQVKIQVEYNLYESFRKGKDYDKALAGFRAFVENYRANDMAPYAQFSIGVCFTEQKEFKKAIEEYTKVINEFKSSSVFGQSILAVGTSYRGLKKDDKAVNYWKQALKDNPGLDVSPQIYFNMGDIYKSNKSDYPTAVKYFTKVVEGYPNSSLFSTAAYMLGECYQKLKNDKLAISYYDKVSSGEKSIRRAADAEIGKLLGKTDPQAAIASYDRIINSAETDIERAIAEMGKGDIYTGIRDYKKAAESYHNIYALYLATSDTMRGGALVKEIDSYNQMAAKRKSYYNTVVKLSDKMVKEFPNNPYTINAIYFKSNAYYSTDRYLQARKVLKKIISLNSSADLTEVAYYQKADCLLFMGKYTKAISEYNVYLKRYPKGKYRAISIYQIGNALWAQEKFSKAKVSYEKVVRDFPNFSERCSAKGFLGYCLDQTGNWKRARKLYREVINSRKCGGESKKFAKDQLEANLVKH